MCFWSCLCCLVHEHSGLVDNNSVLIICPLLRASNYIHMVLHNVSQNYREMWSSSWPETVAANGLVARLTQKRHWDEQLGGQNCTWYCFEVRLRSKCNFWEHGCLQLAWSRLFEIKGEALTIIKVECTQMISNESVKACNRQVPWRKGRDSNAEAGTPTN